MTGAQGFVVWFTGLSGAGKSTLTAALVPELIRRGRRVEVLDGDEVRLHLSKGLGFSREDRDTNILRIGYVANLLARNGVGVVTAAISPYRETRDAVRAMVERDGSAFIEVHLSTPLEVCEARDVKGLYAEARAGRRPGFTGIDDPYEPPLNPELRLDTSETPIKACVAEIVAKLEQLGLLPAIAAEGAR
ncbi:adenylyl-sulfate kinase [Tepidiforma sp.]|uniref:adenylyl-sulfate kinase n=1 Tax=Tepidiforma sp. TaxID=2682230 RepID=UPI002ADE01F4|nr:adenylyl-sulfate kinase [Tepidiforma sp.]